MDLTLNIRTAALQLLELIYRNDLCFDWIIAYRPIEICTLLFPDFYTFYVNNIFHVLMISHTDRKIPKRFLNKFIMFSCHTSCHTLPILYYFFDLISCMSLHIEFA